MHKRKIIFTIAAVTLSLLIVFLTGCRPGPADKDARGGRDILYQVSTIDALLGGLYDGILSYGELQRYGDMGLGTFTALDGEMVAVDGIFYQVKMDGKAYKVADDMQTPFACVTFFDADLKQNVPSGTDFNGLEAYIDSIMPTQNIFYAIVVEGTFSYMKTRSVPAQEKPYPPLAQVTPHQAVFDFKNVEGTVVGFRCPDYVSGLNVAGYHLHFLTADRSAGGHVLELETADAALMLDDTSEFTMVLPGKSTGFYTMDFTPDTSDALQGIER